MPEQTQIEETALKACEQCEHWQEAKRKVRLAELLIKASNGFLQRMEANEFKPTLGDYIKLLQMEKELNGDTTKEIKVTWIDPAPTSDSEK
jgi:hypothetical protein